jgi:hypothetical protein
MPRQIRSLSGSIFEKEICQTMGFTSKPTSPQIKWSGKGRCNFSKIKNCDFNPSLFRPLNTSYYNKWDVITKEGQKIEVKKYHLNQLTNWTLYSEPIIKVAARDVERKLTKLYGDGNSELARQKYNSFLKELFTQLQSEGILEQIKNNITSTNKGIQFIDGFLTHNQLEFRWDIRSGWNGFDRVYLEFRRIQNSD